MGWNPLKDVQNAVDTVTGNSSNSSSTSLGFKLPNFGNGSAGTSIPGVSLPNLTPSQAGLTSFLLSNGSSGGVSGGGATAAGTAYAGTTAQNIMNARPNLLSPDALSSTPTLAETNTKSIQTQLVAESNAARYGTQLTTGAGLLDQPTTTSRILLGS